jgi:hypothetical protein
MSTGGHYTCDVESGMLNHVLIAVQDSTVDNRSVSVTPIWGSTKRPKRSYRMNALMILRKDTTQEQAWRSEIKDDRIAGDAYVFGITCLVLDGVSGRLISGLRHTTHLGILVPYPERGKPKDMDRPSLGNQAGIERHGEEQPLYTSFLIARIGSSIVFAQDD